MANPALGSKQICPNCQTKFYDLTKRPAHCPKCGTDFDPEEAVKNRRIRARTTTPDYEEAEEKPDQVKGGDEEGFEDEPDDTPEIDQAADEVDATETDEDPDPGAPTPAGGGDDLGVDFEEEGEGDDDADAVPFLEEDEDDLGDEDIDVLPEGEADDER